MTKCGVHPLMLLLKTCKLGFEKLNSITNQEVSLKRKKERAFNLFFCSILGNI